MIQIVLTTRTARVQSLKPDVEIRMQENEIQIQNENETI